MSCCFKEYTGRCRCATFGVCCVAVPVVFLVTVLFLADYNLPLIYEIQSLSNFITYADIMQGESVLKESEMLTRYKAAMVLSGVGDAIGYNRGKWEMCKSGPDIHKELAEMGGISKINVSESRRGNLKWIVSDDTVMHLATAEAFMETGEHNDLEKLYYNIGKHYKECTKDMRLRAPGPTCMYGAQQWSPNWPKRVMLPFDSRAGGCGAAMRAMCIGLRYPRKEDEENLIAVSIESGRMTHHNPTGFLGSLATALFTSYAIQGKPIIEWGHGLVYDILPKAKKYISNSKEYVADNIGIWDHEKGFSASWTRYLEERDLQTGQKEPKFPKVYGVEQRDIFYKYVSYDGWGGSSGHDAPMIAYDSLLAAKDDWTELANRAFFHAGDSDSTAVMAACWFGALYGYKGVPVCNYQGLEYHSRLEKAGEELYKLSHIE